MKKIILISAILMAFVLTGCDSDRVRDYPYPIADIQTGLPSSNN